MSRIMEIIEQKLEYRMAQEEDLHGKCDDLKEIFAEWLLEKFYAENPYA